MEEVRDAVLSRLEELSRAVCELERRTSALERQGRAAAPEEIAPPALEAGPPAAPQAAAQRAGDLAPLFGWALMGIAGAYLLRALTEAGTVPAYAGLAAGMVYAAWWLFLAERRAAEKPVYSTVHGLTAALIVAPMLWETAVRFHLVSTHAASAGLVLFAVLGLAIGWRRNISSIAWIASVAALVAATALFRESHDAAAFTATVLAVALAVEISACRDHWLSLRWIVALAANVSVLLLTWLAARAGGAGAAVAPPAPAAVLAAQAALLTIYIASTVDRTLLRGLTITNFEIGQAAAAFVISVGGALRMLESNGAGATAAGAFCLAGGAACYLVSFAFLDRRHMRDRNFHTYAVFALLLIVSGCHVLLSGAALAGVWAALAAGMLAIGFRGGRDTLRVHAAGYLVLAALAAHLPADAGRLIANLGPPRALPGAAYFAAVAGAAVCYAAMLVWEVRPARRLDRAEAVLTAGLAAWGMAGALSGWLTAFVSPAAPLRTALLAVMAVGAGWAGARWERTELSTLAWPLTAIAGLKLLAEDFQQGRSVTLVVSLILFGGALILLPRLSRRCVR